MRRNELHDIGGRRLPEWHISYRGGLGVGGFWYAVFLPMPVISYFFGIYIRMYFDDHAPPHFHVEYQGHEAFVAIETGETIAGRLPRGAAKLVKE